MTTVGNSKLQECGHEPHEQLVPVPASLLDLLVDGAEIRLKQYRDAAAVIREDSFGDARSENIPGEVFECGERGCEKMADYWQRALDSVDVARGLAYAGFDREDVADTIGKLYDALPLGEGEMPAEQHDDVCTYMAWLCESLGLDPTDF